MLPYEKFLYDMKPVREVEPGWWKLRWKPIKNGTWNLYAHKTYRHSCRDRSLGIFWNWGGAHNGWGRSWNGLGVRIGLWWVEIEAWASWKFVIHKDGPMDMENHRPLDIERKWWRND